MHGREAKPPTVLKHFTFGPSNPQGHLKFEPSALPHKPWSSDSSEGHEPSLVHSHDIFWTSAA